MFDETKTRLEAEAPLLRDVHGAGAFSALIAAKVAPTTTPVAYVVPVAMRGGSNEDSAGAFVQNTDETLSVIIMLRSNDRVGDKGVEPIIAVRDQVIASIAGWTPSTQTGSFALRGAKMTSVVAGLLVYQVEFSISDQLRIFQ